jgi:sec-independent protein translocase protein TatB
MSSGIGFSELIILALIGLIVLGPEKLPRVASQIGNWVGQARRMTRVMRRQLEDELDFDENLNQKNPTPSSTPRDDDTYSPVHADESAALSETADALAAKPAAATDEDAQDAATTDDVEQTNDAEESVTDAPEEANK